MAVQKATADGIRMLNESNPGQPVLTIKSLEALEKVADGRSTKLIIPSNLQSIAGLVTSVKEMISDAEK